MNAKYFLDTSIFVYSFDANHSSKKERALALVEDAFQSGLGIISSHVIQEFLNFATRKFTISLKTEA